MTVTIWIDGWQMQCCAERFRSGAVGEWQVVEADAEDHADVVGAGRAAEVHCRYEVAGDGIGYPVAGSTELVPVERADGWATERPGVSFAGYLVTAEPVGE